MANETEAGTISSALAKSLLLIENEHELRTLERDGFIKKIGKDTYRLPDLIRGFARWAREQRDLTDIETMCTILGVTRPRITHMVTEGILKFASKKNRFDWKDAFASYVRWSKGEGRRTTKSAAESRVRDAKAHDIEIRTAERLGILIPTDTALEVIDEISGMVRSEFAGLAAACTRDLTMRRIIEREVNARLNRLSTLAMERARALEAVRGKHADLAASGAGRVGGSEPDVSINGGGAGSA